MERLFCIGKKDFCDNPDVCGSCDFVDGSGSVNERTISALFPALFGKDYDLDRLKQLIEADREGRCVVSPCKVGDRLYTIRTIQDGSFTLEVYDSGKIRQISVNTDGTFFLVDYGHSLSANNFGKTVFRTREEAEAALKERKVNSKSIEVNAEVN